MLFGKKFSNSSFRDDCILLEQYEKKYGKIEGERLWKENNPIEEYRKSNNLYKLITGQELPCSGSILDYGYQNTSINVTPQWVDKVSQLL